MTTFEISAGIGPVTTWTPSIEIVAVPLTRWI
jgi:hypothetical protein